MPVPKHKFSKSRRDKRAAHYRVNAPAVAECPRCRHVKRPHVACPYCGYYNGRQVLIKKKKEKKKE